VIEINPQGLKPANPVLDASKILQRADLVWSRMKLEPNEILLVKVSKHMAPMMGDIKDLMDHVFKREGDRVIVYLDGDIEFTRLDTGEK
jgi:hypothetical protein